MTRKTHIIIFNRKIYRGTLDEIDKLRNELAKAERDLEKFEDIYKAELVNGINVPKNDE